MKVLAVVHSEAGPPRTFGDVLAERAHRLETWRPHVDATPPAVDAYDAVMVFGGGMHVDQEAEHPWLTGERQYLRELLDRDVPVLGVCLGAQLVAGAAGAAVGPAAEPEIGWFEVERTADDPVLGVLPTRFLAFQWHFYAFEVPAGGQELACSAVCPQAFRLGRAWGVQFHPEVTREIVSSWIDEAPDETPEGSRRRPSASTGGLASAASSARPFSTRPHRSASAVCKGSSHDLAFGRASRYGQHELVAATKGAGMRSPGALRLLVLAVVVTAAVGAAGSAQAAGVLYGVVQEQVWGCPSPPGSPPTIGSCPDSTSPDVTVTADCHPDSTSTIDISVNGYLSGSGSFTEQIHAQIGPQTGPPAQEFKPFPSFSGGSAGSIGLPTGQLTSYTASFTLGDGTTGTKSLVPDLGNTGVCLDLTGQSAPNNAFPVGTLTGRFWILNAQSLSYDAVIPNTSPDETGVAEAYFDDSYATYDGSGPTDPVASDDGSYLAGFGTTHVDTAPGTNVTVSPSPNVSLDFSSVTGDGVTSAQPLTSPPQVPANFQVGNPPVAFDISTTASFTGSVTVCLPYGTLPPGDAPALLHYDGTQWVDVTTSVDQPPGTVCGSVTSFSPFVAAFAPAAPKTTADCKNGGWMKYTNPKFKNQGDCVSWVATHGRNGGNG